MSGEIVTCLWFDGKAQEAAEFYLSVFKDGSIGRVAHYNDAGPGEPGSVMVVEFTVNGQKFVGLNGGSEFTFNEAVSFQVPCADQAEADYYWAKLTEGGEEGPCGWLRDRFGLSWQVFPSEVLDLVTDPDPAKAKRATEAMYQMKKIDLETIRKAHAGQ